MAVMEHFCLTELGSLGAYVQTGHLAANVSVGSMQTVWCWLIVHEDRIIYEIFT